MICMNEIDPFPPLLSKMEFQNPTYKLFRKILRLSEIFEISFIIYLQSDELMNSLKNALE